MEATTPASATTATSTKTTRLIRCLLHICVSEPVRHLAITDQGAEQAASPAIPHQGCRPRLAERSECRADLLLLDDLLLGLLCNLVGANRQSPVRPDEMAGVAAGISLEIILMLGFGFPEVACGNDFGNDLARPQA